MLNHNYFTPSEVSKVTTVSTRTLRYYHEIGLLVPSYVDDNGYRYYHSQDIAKLQTILFLRQLNLSLEDIQLYFQQSITNKNAILEDNYAQIVQPLGTNGKCGGEHRGLVHHLIIYVLHFARLRVSY